MAKKSEPPKPIYPIKYEFYASLDNFLQQAGMLADVIDQIVKLGAITNEGAKKAIQERLDAFRKARFGEDRDG